MEVMAVACLPRRAQSEQRRTTISVGSSRVFLPSCCVSRAVEVVEESRLSSLARTKFSTSKLKRELWAKCAGGPVDAKRYSIRAQQTAAPNLPSPVLNLRISLHLTLTGTSTRFVTS